MKQLLFLTLFVGLCQLKQAVIIDAPDEISLVNLDLFEPATEILDNQCPATRNHDLIFQTISLDCFDDEKMDNLTKEVFFEYLENCFQNLSSKYKLCLNETHQYLPDFLLDVGKNLVTVLYEFNHNTTYREDIVNCEKKLSYVPYEYDSKSEYYCFKTRHDTKELLDSKEHFCGVYIPIFDCLGNRVKKFCGDNDFVVKYVKTIRNYLRKPCGQEELI